MVSHRKLCKRCLMFKYEKSRGLCETCWKEARADGFKHYPLRSEVDPRLVCHCLAPIPEHLAMWDAVQCKRCGKKVL